MDTAGRVLELSQLLVRRREGEGRGDSVRKWERESTGGKRRV